jgi:hypothetical protein
MQTKMKFSTCREKIPLSLSAIQYTEFNAHAHGGAGPGARFVVRFCFKDVPCLILFAAL